MIRGLTCALIVICLSEASEASVAFAQQVPARNPNVTAQMGVKVTPDTVTIGDPFIVVVRVKVSPGFKAEFPQMPDSTVGTPSKISLVGTPLLERAPGDTLEFRATYRLTAWDVGLQSIPLTDIYVTGTGGTGFIPLKAAVFVKSVLPQDSALRVPKPPRERFPIEKTNWWPLIILAIAIALAELLWAIYKRYRAYRNRPRDPYEVANEEFRRVEALQLTQKGESERHALLMAEAMRAYLAARVPAAALSDTPRQLVDHVLDARLADERVREVMREAELLKFARGSATPETAMRLGKDSREIVELVQQQLQPREAEAKAA